MQNAKVSFANKFLFSLDIEHSMDSNAEISNFTSGDFDRIAQKSKLKESIQRIDGMFDKNIKK